MTIAETILPQFDHEIATTRRVLERVPATDLEWKPHPKSWSMGDLANHIVACVGWGAPTMTMTTLDLTPKPGQPAPERAASPEALVALLQRNAAGTRAAIAAASDEDFRTPWSLRSGTTTIFTMSRVAVIRGFVLSHIIHHRGEMMVYLRLRDVPLPAVYGPSADEG